VHPLKLAHRGYSKAPDLSPFDHESNSYAGPSIDEVRRLREKQLRPGIFLHYKKPTVVVAGKFHRVMDAIGKRYLDAWEASSRLAWDIVMQR